MKRIFREGTKLFGRTVMVLFISVFVCVSVSGLCTALSTEESGYEGRRKMKGMRSRCIRTVTKTARIFPSEKSCCIKAEGNRRSKNGRLFWIFQL